MKRSWAMVRVLSTMVVLLTAFSTMLPMAPGAGPQEEEGAGQREAVAALKLAPAPRPGTPRLALLTSWATRPQPPQASSSAPRPACGPTPRLRLSRLLI